MIRRSFDFRPPSAEALLARTGAAAPNLLAQAAFAPAAPPAAAGAAVGSSTSLADAPAWRAVPLLAREDEGLDLCGRAGTYLAAGDRAGVEALAARVAAIDADARVLVHAVPAAVRISGVAWSEHPASGSLDQIVVEAVRGLPEAIFAGVGAPERVTVDPAALRENGRRPGAMGARVERDAAAPSGRRLVDVDPSERSDAVLTLPEAGAVAGLVVKLVEATGEAVEIVWAIPEGDGPQVWEIRSPARRADARLRGALVAQEVDRLRERYRFAQELFTRDTVDKILDVPTPMTRSLFERITGPDGARGRSLKWLGFPFDPDENQKCYSFLFDHAYIDTAAGFRALTAGLPLDIDASRYHLAASAEIRDLPKYLNWKRMGAAEWLRLPLTALQVATIPLRTTWHAFHLREGYDAGVRPELFAWIDRHRKADLATYDAAALAEVVDEGERRIQHVYAQHQMADIFSIFPIKMIERLVRLAGKDPFPFFNSTRLEVEAIYRRRCDRELLEVAEGKRERTDFLEEHGYRATPEWEFAEPRWREDPALVDEQIRRVRETAGVRRARELRTAEEVAREGWEMLGGLAGAPIERVPLYGWLMRRFYRDYLLWADIKERAWFDCVRIVEVMRLAMLEADRRAGLHGMIFYATLDEVRPILGGSNLGVTLRRRRRRIELMSTLELPKTMTLETLERTAREYAVDPKAAPEGEGAAPGVAEAPVRVFASAAEAAAAPPESLAGHILAVPELTADLAAGLPAVAGLAVETPGTLSLAALLARARGIPCAAGLPRVSHLTGGRRYRLDGGLGAVTPAEG